MIYPMEFGQSFVFWWVFLDHLQSLFPINVSFRKFAFSINNSLMLPNPGWEWLSQIQPRPTRCSYIFRIGNAGGVNCSNRQAFSMVFNFAKTPTRKVPGTAIVHLWHRTLSAISNWIYWCTWRILKKYPTPLPSYYNQASRNGWHPIECTKTGTHFFLFDLSWRRSHDYWFRFCIRKFWCIINAIPRTRTIHVEGVYARAIHKSSKLDMKGCTQHFYSWRSNLHCCW